MTARPLVRHVVHGACMARWRVHGALWRRWEALDSGLGSVLFFPGAFISGAKGYHDGFHVNTIKCLSLKYV
jgi:hypothetical protein